MRLRLWAALPRSWQSRDCGAHDESRYACIVAHDTMDYQVDIMARPSNNLLGGYLCAGQYSRPGSGHGEKGGGAISRHHQIVTPPPITARGWSAPRLGSRLWFTAGPSSPPDIPEKDWLLDQWITPLIHGPLPDISDVRQHVDRFKSQLRTRAAKLDETAACLRQLVLRHDPTVLIPSIAVPTSSVAWREGESIDGRADHVL